jgi:hypothetical protein
MADLAWHFNNSLLDRRVIARSVAERRLLARCVIRIGAEFDLGAFRCSGTHLHYLLFCSRERAGRFIQRVDESLRRGLQLPVGFGVAYGKPVDSQAYLRTVFDYVVGNTDKHETAWDPLHEASMLPDLLGLRLLGAYAPALVRGHLPNVTRRKLLAWFGLPELEPDDGFDGIAEAAAAALGLPHLAGGGGDTNRARCALVHVAGDHLRPAELARLAGVSERSLRRLRGRKPEPALVRALRLQITLRRVHAGRQAEDPLFAGEGEADYQPSVENGG